MVWLQSQKAAVIALQGKVGCAVGWAGLVWMLLGAKHCRQKEHSCCVTTKGIRSPKALCSIHSGPRLVDKVQAAPIGSFLPAGTSFSLEMSGLFFLPTY